MIAIKNFKKRIKDWKKVTAKILMSLKKTVLLAYTVRLKKQQQKKNKNTILGLQSTQPNSPLR